MDIEFLSMADALEIHSNFFMLNGYEIQATNQQCESLVAAVATGEWSKPQIAEFLRLHSRPHQP